MSTMRGSNASVRQTGHCWLRRSHLVKHSAWKLQRIVSSALRAWIQKERLNAHMEAPREHDGKLVDAEPCEADHAVDAPHADDAQLLLDPPLLVDAPPNELDPRNVERFNFGEGGSYGLSGTEDFADEEEFLRSWERVSGGVREPRRKGTHVVVGEVVVLQSREEKIEIRVHKVVSCRRRHSSLRRLSALLELRGKRDLKRRRRGRRSRWESCADFRIDDEMVRVRRRWWHRRLCSCSLAKDGVGVNSVAGSRGYWKRSTLSSRRGRLEGDRGEGRRRRRGTRWWRSRGWGRRCWTAQGWEASWDASGRRRGRTIWLERICESVAIVL